jgi:hypothetical protein
MIGARTVGDVAIVTQKPASMAAFYQNLLGMEGMLPEAFSLLQGGRS